MKRRILLADTHFGVRSNSTTWLKSQLRFLDGQLTDFIHRLRDDGVEITMCHLGDFFDSRSSINTNTFHEAEKAFSRVASLCDSTFIIGGNHDYYSPVEDRVFNVNSIDLLRIPDCKILSQKCESFDGALMIPWFTFHNPDKLRDALDKFSDSTILTHTDLEHLDSDAASLLIGRTVYSGHIHIPSMKSPMFNLGSCYSINFADHDSERGFYVLDENWRNPVFIPNEESIRFYRLTAEDLLDEDRISRIRQDDLVEVSIDTSEYSVESTKKMIGDLNERCSCRTVVRSAEIVSESCERSVESDIVDICRKSMPEHLIEKFEKISKAIKK